MINKISKQTIENGKLIVELKANVYNLQNTLDNFIVKLRLGFWTVIATFASFALLIISIEIWG